MITSVYAHGGVDDDEGATYNKTQRKNGGRGVSVCEVRKEEGAVECG